MNRIMMESASTFGPKNVEEINKLLKDNWDIVEGPQQVGPFIYIKLAKSDGSLSSNLMKFEDDGDHSW